MNRSSRKLTPPSDMRCRELTKEQLGVDVAHEFPAGSTLGDEWQPGSTELTPTMKLRRKAVEEKYSERIESLYAEDPA